MTLAMLVINKHGLTLCTDHRLTRGDGAYSDHGQKQLVILCGDGGIGIAYSGIGEVRGSEVSMELRQRFRGTTMHVDEVIHDLAEISDKVYGKWRRPHTFLIGAFINETPRAYRLTNRSGASVTRSFTLDEQEVGAGLALADGSGSDTFARQDWRLLEKIQTVRRGVDGALLRLNEHAARSTVSVSASCLITYMPPTGKSVSGVNTPGATAGAAIVITADGTDTRELMDVLAQRGLVSSPELVSELYEKLIGPARTRKKT